jgi:endoglucanase
MRLYKLISLVSIVGLLFGMLPTLSLATVHGDGTNVRDGGGVIYLISNGQRRPFTSAGAFLSYAYNTWSTVVPGSDEDLRLPVGSFVPPQDGSVMCSDRGNDTGTCYLITDGKKAGFTSEAVFKSLGFTFHKDIFYGDVSWLSSDSPISSSNEAHRNGVLVSKNGAVHLVTSSGLVGIPDVYVFNSWGFRFTNVVPANGYDFNRSASGLLGMRQGGAVSSLTGVYSNNSQTTYSYSSNNSNAVSSNSTSQINTTTVTATVNNNTTSNTQSTAQQTNTNINSNTTLPSEFYVNQDSQPAQWVKNNKQSRPQDAALIEKISTRAFGSWFGNWNGDIQKDVSDYVSKAQTVGKTPILVAYNIPVRDCGSYSAGGSNSPQAYLEWITKFSAGVGNKPALVILEPDAIPGADCLSEEGRNTRYDLLKQAVTKLKANSSTKVYIDSGHAKWKSADEMADRLNKSGIALADGFSLNVSNYVTTADNTSYGQQISAKVGNKHFVIDTSRNGNGPTQDNQWCNPSGRALGTPSTTATGNNLIDAYLWIKVPGESDGGCNGGPGAGQFWAEYAIGLSQRAGF